MSAPDYALYRPEDFSCAHGGVHRCENDSADHRGARLIHAVHHARIKDSSRRLLGFYYCALPATLSVFTRAGPFWLLAASGDCWLHSMREATFRR
jgi:hypothetical protein